MSTLTLPTRDKPVKPTRVGSKILVLYSLPKVGKTEQLVELAKVQDCLIIDAEQPHGTDTYETTAVKVDSVADMNATGLAIYNETKKRETQGHTGIDKFPYKFIAIDTIDSVEDMAEISATAAYKESTIGKTFKGKSVLELPQGGGYYYLRQEVQEIINRFAQVCPYLILIVHVKEKLIANKDGTEVKVNDISLTGKLSSIVCASADAIGYMYRDGKGGLMVSFETYDGAIMGARQKYLAGQKIEFSWERIYPEVFGIDHTTLPVLNSHSPKGATTTSNT